MLDLTPNGAATKICFYYYWALNVEKIKFGKTMYFSQHNNFFVYQLFIRSWIIINRLAGNLQKKEKENTAK